MSWKILRKRSKFLEALGYQKSIYYEKYRTTYELDETLIMLDELPYGNFVEIEGETVEGDPRCRWQSFNLNWDAAIRTSYTALFERACAGAMELVLPGSLVCEFW